MKCQVCGETGCVSEGEPPHGILVLPQALDAVLNSEASGSQPAIGGDSAEAVSHEIARSNMSTFLTPSSIAAELRPDLDPVEAADIYTGGEILLCSASRLESRCRRTWLRLYLGPWKPLTSARVG